MKTRSKVGILLLSLPLCLALTGCSVIKLYPISKQDIVVMQKSVPYTPDRDGYFLSNLYMTEVMQAKVDKENLR